jgi:hypothetical protein
MRLQLLHELKAEENATEMFRNALRDCAMDTLLDVTVEGEPEVVEKDPIRAKLRIEIRFSADMKGWRRLQGQLKRLLEAVTEERTVISTASPYPATPSGEACFWVSNEDTQSLRETWGPIRQTTTQIWLLQPANRLARRPYGIGPATRSPAARPTAAGRCRSR